MKMIIISATRPDTGTLRFNFMKGGDCPRFIRFLRNAGYELDIKDSVTPIESRSEKEMRRVTQTMAAFRHTLDMQEMCQDNTDVKYA